MRLPVPEPFMWDEDGEPCGWIEARDDVTGQPCGFSYRETDRARERRIADALKNVPRLTEGMARTLQDARRRARQ